MAGKSLAGTDSTDKAARRLRGWPMEKVGVETRKVCAVWVRKGDLLPKLYQRNWEKVVEVWLTFSGNGLVTTQTTCCSHPPPSSIHSVNQAESPTTWQAPHSMLRLHRDQVQKHPWRTCRLVAHKKLWWLWKATVGLNGEPQEHSFPQQHLTLLQSYWTVMVSLTLPIQMSFLPIILFLMLMFPSFIWLNHTHAPHPPTCTFCLFLCATRAHVTLSCYNI